MTIEAIIFDLDGTLLDSLADIADAANAVLEARGLPTHDVSAYRYFVGDGARRLIQRTVPPECRDETPLLEELLADFVTRYQASWNVQSRLYDGIPEMLDTLVQRRLPLAVLSNKPETATRACVEHFLSAYAFVAVLGQTEQRPPKPDLTGVREALALLNVPPPACLYLGDTAVDMQTACRAGTFAVGATWGFRDRAELEQGGARQIIDHPREFVALVDGNPRPNSC